MKPCPFCAKEIPDGAIVCRYCRRDLKTGALPGEAAALERSAINRKQVVRLLLVIGLLIGGSTLVFIFVPVARPQLREPGAEPDIHSLDDVATQYTHFRGERIIVEGTVDRIDRDAQTGPFAMLKARTTPSIRATFQSADEALMLRWQPTQHVRMRCQVAGDAATPALRDCEVLP